MGRPYLRMMADPRLFNFPEISGKQYRPGRQPYSPGESQMDGQQWPQFHAIPWPRPVATLATLASHPGIPRNRGLQIDNNSKAILPGNYLFLSGTAGKSRQ